MENLIQLECNIDDTTPEVLSYAAERVLKAGALDVWMTPIIMKKGRPAVILSVLSRPEFVDALTNILFKETTTIGIRQMNYLRRSLPWKIFSVSTLYGELKVKVICMDGEIVTISPEFESCRQVAGEYGLPLQKIYDAAMEAGRELIIECPEDIND